MQLSSETLAGEMRERRLDAAVAVVSWVPVFPLLARAWACAMMVPAPDGLGIPPRASIFGSRRIRYDEFLKWEPMFLSVPKEQPWATPSLVVSPRANAGAS